MVSCLFGAKANYVRVLRRCRERVGCSPLSGVDSDSDDSRIVSYRQNA